MAPARRAAHLPVAQRAVPLAKIECARTRWALSLMAAARAQHELVPPKELPMHLAEAVSLAGGVALPCSLIAL